MAQPIRKPVSPQTNLPAKNTIQATAGQFRAVRAQGQAPPKQSLAKAASATRPGYKTGGT